MINKLLVVTALFLPVISFAHGNKASMTAASIVVATEKFEKDYAAQLVNYTGVKGWPEGAKVQVKIYLTNSKVIGYSCHMMGTNVMCDRVN
ncbi:MAG: hypothetical protein SGI74_02485 [Oligoflexia bacterium]|nr:hypothetical protein [Oligoflexia bacterium]